MSYIQKQGQDAAWEKGVMRNLATDVILYGRIQTTEFKAKKLKTVLDRLVTFGKKGTVSARREAAKFLRNETDDKNVKAVKKLFDEIAPKYKDRNGGYTRVLKVKNRKGDNAPIYLIEFV